MPYQSKAQQGYFHAHRRELERQGVDVAEWDRKSKGRPLPERLPRQARAHAARHLGRLAR